MRMRKRETEQEAIIRRQKQYGCDGHCYGVSFDDDGNRQEWMCGGIDHGCPEHIIRNNSNDYSLFINGSDIRCTDYCVCDFSDR